MKKFGMPIAVNGPASGAPTRPGTAAPSAAGAGSPSVRVGRPGRRPDWCLRPVSPSRALAFGRPLRSDVRSTRSSEPDDAGRLAEGTVSGAAGAGVGVAGGSGAGVGVGSGVGAGDGVGVGSGVGAGGGVGVGWGVGVGGGGSTGVGVGVAPESAGASSTGSCAVTVWPGTAAYRGALVAAMARILRASRA